MGAKNGSDHVEVPLGLVERAALENTARAVSEAHSALKQAQAQQSEMVRELCVRAGVPAPQAAFRAEVSEDGKTLAIYATATAPAAKAAAEVGG